MTITKIAVVYSKKQKVRRRVIVINHEGGEDAHYDAHKLDLHPGEGWLEIPLDIYRSFQSPHELNDYIALQIGERQSDRCCVVCPIEGTVKHLIHADPEIDFHPAGKIVQHHTAQIGDKL